MSDIVKVTQPELGSGKDPNDCRNDPKFQRYLKETIVSDSRQPKRDAILDRLVNMSATNRLKDMEENLKNDFFVFPDMALAGLMTLFYAKANTGKTLLFMRFLIDAITDNRIKGEDVFYINADDNYKGLYTKAKIAKEYGFYMISPQEANVSPMGVLDLLARLAKDRGVAGKVIVMDTLKKFTDMMNKGKQAALYEVLRGLVTKGATVIIAGHANKHLDADGKLVYEGTSDTMNDLDCVYSMYRMSEPEADTQIVEFRREKDRGSVVAKTAYQYTKVNGMHYRDIISSVTWLDDQQASRASIESRKRELLEKYESEILFVESLLVNGPMNQSEILTSRSKSKDALAGEVSARSLKASLNKLDGIAWSIKRNDKNAKVFSLIDADISQYRSASNGA